MRSHLCWTPSPLQGFFVSSALTTLRDTSLLSSRPGDLKKKKKEQEPLRSVELVLVELTPETLASRTEILMRHISLYPPLFQPGAPWEVCAMPSISSTQSKYPSPEFYSSLFPYPENRNYCAGCGSAYLFLDKINHIAYE